MKAILRELTPAPVWNALRHAKFYAIDTAAIYRGRPPKDLADSIGGQFDKVGYKLVEFFKSHNLISPASSVLEIGCGIGRIAIPLAQYLTQGHYEGFDIVKRSVNWCDAAITSEHPHFKFKHADIFNKTYNQNGRFSARDFRFPYDDKTFDFVFLTSVFTHMLPKDIEHYFDEIARVMKPDSFCLTTWFLLNDESEALIQSGQSFLTFDHKLGKCLVADADIPEVAIAYKEQIVDEFHKSVGMSKSQPTEYGSWCGRKGTVEGQDICVYRFD